MLETENSDSKPGWMETLVSPGRQPSKGNKTQTTTNRPPGLGVGLRANNPHPKNIVIMEPGTFWPQQAVDLNVETNTAWR